MTGCEVCWKCQSEYPCEVGQVGKYRVVYGWCSECNQARIIWQNEAYEDDDFNVHVESDKIGKMLYDVHYKGFKIVDTPEFQFKWTEKPTEAHYCQSCVHGCKIIENGEDKGDGCRIGKKPDWDYEAYKNRCTEYKPRDTWNNMGGQCRYCLKNIQGRCVHKGDLKDVSEYDKGHCENYVYSDIWGFERYGLRQCWKCGAMASLKKSGRIKCESCGESWKDEEGC